MQADAAAAGRVTLVYFRDWSAVECTQFEEKVLSDPAVRRETAPLHCVPLSYHWDKPLADAWKIDRIPAVVLVDPRGRVLAQLKNPIAKETLIDAIRQARGTTSSPATQPQGG